MKVQNNEPQEFMFEKDAPKIRLARSFIVQSNEQIPVASKNLQDNGNKMKLSLIQIQRHKRSADSLLKEVLSQKSIASQQSRDNDLVDIINMPDQQFLKKYETNPLFKNSIDLKIKKRRRRSMMVGQDTDLDELAVPLSKNNIVTLRGKVMQSKISQKQLFDKYVRTVGKYKNI